MAELTKKKQGPPQIKAASSNTISDCYRDSITIAYQYINGVVPATDFTFCGKSFEMTAELKGAMANTGSRDLAHINAGSIVLP